MNYIAHLNGYRERRKIEPLSTNEIALYFIILEYCNEIGWKEWFTVSNGVLQGLSGLSRSAFHRARGELARLGYIKYRDGSGNQCGRYLIVDFGTQSETQSETQMEHSPGRNVEPLDKPKTETKTNKKDICTFFESIWRLYPNKKGKGQVSDTQKRKLYGIGLDELSRCIERYEANKPEWQAFQNGSTFFNSGYVDYLNKNYSTESGDLPQNGDRREDGRVFLDGKWVQV